MRKLLTIGAAVVIVGLGVCDAPGRAGDQSTESKLRLHIHSLEHSSGNVRLGAAIALADLGPKAAPARSKSLSPSDIPSAGGASGASITPAPGAGIAPTPTGSQGTAVANTQVASNSSKIKFGDGLLSR